MVKTDGTSRRWRRW